jgi:hypothetical protein
VLFLVITASVGDRSNVIRINKKVFLIQIFEDPVKYEGRDVTQNGRYCKVPYYNELVSWPSRRVEGKKDRTKL